MNDQQLAEEIDWLRWCLKYLPHAQYGARARVTECRRRLDNALTYQRFRQKAQKP